MRLEKLEIRNFRCFEQLEVELAGDSLILVGANAAGKSTLLGAGRLALHGGRVFQAGLRDLQVPAEMIATLTGIAPAVQGSFGDVMDFSVTPPTLRIGLRATWDADELEVQNVHGYPDHAWSRSKWPADDRAAAGRGRTRQRLGVEPQRVRMERPTAGCESAPPR